MPTSIYTAKAAKDLVNRGKLTDILLLIHMVTITPVIFFYKCKTFHHVYVCVRACVRGKSDVYIRHSNYHRQFVRIQSRLDY